MIIHTAKNCMTWIGLVLAATLVLSGDALLSRTHAEDAKKAKASEASKRSLGQKLIGTWVLVGEPGNVRKAPKSGGRLKFFTGKRWCITQADPRTGKVRFHHGGTYSLDGDKLSEAIEYANESTAALLKKTLLFKVKVERDTYTQIGIDNPYTEVWKRLK